MEHYLELKLEKKYFKETESKETLENGTGLRFLRDQKPKTLKSIKLTKMKVLQMTKLSGRNFESEKLDGHYPFIWVYGIMLNLV
jgi:hypothetical protein